MIEHIIIEGLMGSGKSKVSRLLAKSLDLACVDVDKKITTKMNMSVNDIFERFGEAYFRAMETYTLKELLSEKKRSVICIGGGLATMEQNHPYLKQLGKVVYLKKPAAVLISQLEEKKADDPFFKDGQIKEKVEKMLKEREPSYEKVADIILECGSLSTEDIVEEIKKKIS